ncbi:hypothetical protein [Haloarcula halophila]|nr:hypothetical protein [Halomicroarcula sp. DFY41]
MATADRVTRLLVTAAGRVAALDRGWRAIVVAALVTGLVIGGLPIPW